MTRSEENEESSRARNRRIYLALGFVVVTAFNIYQAFKRSGAMIRHAATAPPLFRVILDEASMDVKKNEASMDVKENVDMTQRDSAEKRTFPAAEEDSEKSREENERSDDASEKPLNIVLFYADDWTARTLGAVNPLVKTPHIDEMARKGMLFKRNCVTTSVCWTSRATMYTGVYASIHQQWKIPDENMYNKTVSWPDTLYPLLKRHGYHTGFVGKWHHPSPKEHMKYTFDYREMYYGKHWYENIHVTELNTIHSLEFLDRRPKDQPFALTVSFFATHALDGDPYPNNFQPQPQSMQLYVNETIPLPRTSTQDHWNRMPWFFNHMFVGRERWVKSYQGERFQVTMKNYYRMATEVDTACGKIIAELKRQGVYNNTLLIFTTDNGNIHGQHEITEKWIGMDESIRVPLVIQDPRMPLEQQGQINDDFTLSVDLAPTMLSAAQIRVPSFMQGRDMAQLYLDPEQAAKSWRQDFFYEYKTDDLPEEAFRPNTFYTPSANALVQKEYKYLYYPQFKYEQLFNIKKDPWEEFDLLNSTATADVQALKRLRRRYMSLKVHAQSGKPV